MQIDDFIIVKNLIAADVCHDLIELCKIDDNWEQHKWYAPSSDSAKSRSTKELDVLYNKDAVSLQPVLMECINNYYKTTRLDGLITQFSPPRFNRYNSGTVMSEHSDLIRRHQDDGIPVLSIVGLLNNNYTGGEFVMNNKIINLKQGDVLVFPSTFLYRHRVEEVTEGTRYSFVSWAY